MMKTPHLFHLLYRLLSVNITLAALIFTGSTRAQENRDSFYWLGEQNKASVVMLTEEGIITKELGAKIADAVIKVLADGAKPGAVRSRDYLEVEKSMIAIGGPAVTRVHSGRSRQDLGQTSSRLFLRDAMLNTFGQFIKARETLLAFAEAHPNAIVPFYTHGVQAQPTAFGHYLGGYLQAFSRGADRYKQSWARLNLSPLGGAAGGTSSFPVNRQRLAELLGFDGIVLNSFDGGQISQMDTGVENVSIAASSALTIGMLCADITDQYSFPHPWLRFTEGDQTGISSIMPQKRNPTGLEQLHLSASTVTSGAVTYYIQCTNVRSGMGDYKGNTPLQVTQSSGALYGDFVKMLNALTFDEARALDEVNSDYSVTTELADTLQRDADVPFRVGHHFASDLVTYGRSKKLRPSEIPYTEAIRLYAGAANYFKLSDTKLPLTEPQFRKALTAENMVQSAKVAGGPHPAEVARLLAGERARLKTDREWLAATRQKLDDAAKKRDAAVAGLMENK